MGLFYVSGGEPRSLAWDAAPIADSYELAVGTSPGVYSQTQNVGNVTTFLLSGISPALAVNVSYYIVCRAVSSGVESVDSNEIQVLNNAQIA